MTFIYTPERLAALSRTVSDERLKPYLVAAQGEQERALRLYELNARLSAAFYGPLQSLEVTVRNAIDDQFCRQFGPDWTDLKRIKLQNWQCEQVSRAVDEANDDTSRADELFHGDVISNLSFGFWVGVLGPKNDTEIWRKCLHRAFPHRPRGVERKAVQGALNSIRRLRNRVAHHCRIIHRDLVDDHALILEITGWVCPDTSEWIAAHSTFDPDMIPVPQTPLPIAGIPSPDPLPPAIIAAEAMATSASGEPV